MRFYGRASALTAVAVVMAALGCAAGHPRSATLPPTAQPQAVAVVPLGLCEDYPEESRSLEEVSRDISLLRQANVQVLRVSVGWDGVEPERGRFDFAFLDAFVELMRAQRIHLIPYVAYTPRWAVRSPGPDYWRQPPADLAAFAEVMATLAGRYAGRIGSWELWNEPDNKDYWLGSSTEYAGLLAAGARAVHAADPSAQVVMGGVAGHPEFAAQVLADPEVSRLVDIVNAHAYFETWNPQPTEALPAYVASFAGVLAGGTRPLWLAEVGYSTYRRGREVSAGIRTRFAYEHTPLFQAVDLIRTVTLALTRPEVKLVAWYRAKDPPADAPMIGDDNNRHLGVASSDGRPKPALAALALMNRLFGGGFVRLDGNLRVERGPGSHAEVHGFLLSDRVVVIAWIPTVVAGGEGGAGGDAEDSRVEPIAIELPLVASGPVQAVDAEGRPIATAARMMSRPAGLRLDGIELRGGTVAVFDVPVRRPGPLAPASRGL